MFSIRFRLVTLSLGLLLSLPAVAHVDHMPRITHRDKSPVELGPQPFDLVEKMNEGPVKKQLQRCSKSAFHHTLFTIGSKGAPRELPEHTQEAYEAIAKRGAGIVACDVTLTKDKQLVCRHAPCDLHTTTNILATPLASKCSQGFSPYDPVTGKPASAQCCTSDITLDEFKTLRGKINSSNPKATTVDEYLQDSAPDAHNSNSSGTLLSHADSIQLLKKLGVKMMPRLTSVTLSYQGGYTQEDYAQQMLDEYKAARVSSRDVWAQSSDLSDIHYWISRDPAFGKHAVYLETATQPSQLPGANDLRRLRAEGVRILAAPFWALVRLDDSQKLAPSDFALNAREAGLEIVARSSTSHGNSPDAAPLIDQALASALSQDANKMGLLYLLDRDIGVIGVESDWPESVSYYANCMNKK